MPEEVGFEVLHLAVGFEPIGVYRRVGFKLGAWRDVEWFGKRLVEGDDPPAADPRPFDGGRDWASEPSRG